MRDVEREREGGEREGWEGGEREGVTEEMKMRAGEICVD